MAGHIVEVKSHIDNNNHHIEDVLSVRNEVADVTSDNQQSATALESAIATLSETGTQLEQLASTLGQLVQRNRSLQKAG